MTTTRTHSIPIGFRQGGSPWQTDLATLTGFASENGFEHIDMRPLDPADLKSVIDSGIDLGTVDLKDWRTLASPDAAKRKDAVAVNAEYIANAHQTASANVFFLVLLPEDQARARAENFAFAVEALNELCAAVASLDVHLSIEGWPGGPPHYPSLGCTPGDLRALFEHVPSPVLGINFDPSHLIRMQINPLCFLSEFASRVVHVHGKDTEILDEELYAHGNLQPATFAKSHGFGAHHWRYTIPGHGIARWTQMFEVLKQAGYRGVVSIELEDENFNGSEDGEKTGLIAAKDFLVGV